LARADRNPTRSVRFPHVSLRPDRSRKASDLAATIAKQQAALTLTADTACNSRIGASAGRLAATVIASRHADEVIGRDRDAARACIARASALLRDDVRPAHASAALVQGGLAPWQISRVKVHVEANLDSTLRIGDLAAIARLSTGHFCRAFTRSFGLAPFAYVAGRRLAHAQELMLTTDDPLSQIALACGLCDQSHLTRLFRRHVGTSRTSGGAAIAEPAASSRARSTQPEPGIGRRDQPAHLSRCMREL
jgi:transcriptional regulator GlxA family with amidase domain